MQVVMGKQVLDGNYLVYYDDAKTKLMARVGFDNDIAHGVFERYNLDGKKIYSTTINQGVINGVLNFIKNSKNVVSITYDNNTPVSAIVDLSFKYEIEFIADSPIFSIRRDNGVNKVIEGTFDPSRYIATLDRYLGNVKRTSIIQVDDKYQGDCEEAFNQSSKVCYTYNEGLITNPVNVFDTMFGRNINLTFGAPSIVTSVGTA